MTLSIILAIARDGAIGHNGDLLWRLSPDLKHFRQLTMGHPVIMGRRTWESLPKGALPGRRNIVVSRNENLATPGAERVSGLEQALELCRGLQKAYIIGGAQLYNAAMPMADELELTRVDAAFPEADTRMADPSQAPGMSLVKASEWMHDERSGLNFRFETYESSHNK